MVKIMATFLQETGVCVVAVKIVSQMPANTVLFQGFPARPAPPRSPPQAVESVWSEHTNAQGTKYWYNKITKSSTWEKPDELKSPEEVC
jgi:hypothetical protein